MEYGYNENPFWSSVFGWMAGALAVTAGTAWYVASMPQLFSFFIQRPIVLFLLFIGQLALVFVFTKLIERMHFWWSFLAFALYALSLGITLSTIFKVYAASSIYLTFFISAGMFACMAVYGLVTRADLSSMGSILMMMLFGLIIGFLVNMFFHSSAFETMLSFVGVIVFALLTAYDMQKLRQLRHVAYSSAQTSVIALSGAFTLYLDFINLFLMLLRLLGKRNND